VGGNGLLFIISGPSGTGKSTLCKELIRCCPEVRFSVSYTTRPPRKDEIAGKDYIFVSSEAFKAMIEQGEFAEWAEVYGHCYGTPRAAIEQALKEGQDLLFDIDCQGTRQLQQCYPQGITIFVLPPSLSELQRRLQGRKTDSSEVMQSRLSKAHREISQAIGYDYIVVNAALADTVSVIQSIVTAEKHRRQYVLEHLSLVKDLLKA